ncbi:hypothetical protein TNCV_3714461 [Trichonephila clavipes]|nr:hypothetical protein TNCV_3714461 [Trichonephila clavipes]
MLTISRQYLASDESMDRINLSVKNLEAVATTRWCHRLKGYDTWGLAVCGKANLPKCSPFERKMQRARRENIQIRLKG